jgi:hypothetical protein
MDKNTNNTVQNDCLSAPELVYEIRVRGHLDEDYWAQWFEGMAVTTDDKGETVLTGPVADQAALYGLLTRIRDLALPLVSVNPVAPDP